MTRIHPDAGVNIGLQQQANKANYLANMRLANRQQVVWRGLMGSLELGGAAIEGWRKDKTMAIGDTVQAGLGGWTSQHFNEQARHRQGLTEAFGNAIGGVVKNTIRRSRRSRREKRAGLSQDGFSAEEAKAASGDKDLANQFMNKLNADRNYQFIRRSFESARYAR